MDPKENHAKSPISGRKPHFINIKHVNLADRTYGFMRVIPQKVGTPYPRAAIGIDANLLNARLKQEQMSRQLEQKVTKRSVSIVGNIDGHELTEKRPTLDSPYPRKGMKLDRESVIKSILPLSGSESLSAPNYPTPTSAGTPVNSLREVCSEKNSRQSLKDGTSSINIEQLSKIFGEDRRDRRSFLERRKDFYEAEYTIANDGIKMSDYSVQLPRQPKQIEDQITFQGYDLKAKEQIDKYIKKLGMHKLNDNVLKHTGMLSNLENRKSISSDNTFHFDES